MADRQHQYATRNNGSTPLDGTDAMNPEVAQILNHMDQVIQAMNNNVQILNNNQNNVPVEKGTDWTLPADFYGEEDPSLLENLIKDYDTLSEAYRRAANIGRVNLALTKQNGKRKVEGQGSGSYNQEGYNNQGSDKRVKTGNGRNQNQLLARNSNCNKCGRNHHGYTCGGTVLTCRFCGHQGHISNECRKRMAAEKQQSHNQGGNNNQRADQRLKSGNGGNRNQQVPGPNHNLGCTRCGRNHRGFTCTNRALPSLSCHFCGFKGHISRDCRKRMATAKQQGNGQFYQGDRQNRNVAVSVNNRAGNNNGAGIGGNAVQGNNQRPGGQIIVMNQTDAEAADNMETGTSSLHNRHAF